MPSAPTQHEASSQFTALSEAPHGATAVIFHPGWQRILAIGPSEVPETNVWSAGNTLYKKFRAGKALVISGREVFEFRPELVNDDDEEADDTRCTQGTGADEVEDSVSVNDIDLSLYIPRDVDETGITLASLERFSTYASDRDENKLSEASGGRAESGEGSDLEEDNELDGQENGAIGAVPVDENLFTGEDLDELEEELNTLDLEG
ncbi:Zinc finger CCCH domain-containing protein 15 [Heterocephalus glaber]|uniref:Zinc finger CCCH domain-containing protein 15 n=1 Tax=Heterocephalus glaber TaxID=10181 RepID=G5AVE0_HETGA|nr:Zinc finger CCCH domain-containing protein 15 [Heterocephalus glaber]